MNKKERIINEILEKIRGPYLMESGLIELTAKGLMKCNNDTLNNLLVLIMSSIQTATSRQAEKIVRDSMPQVVKDVIDGKRDR